MGLGHWILVAASLASYSTAYPQWSQSLSLASRQDDPHSYQKPGPTDVRSPCPGHNTLANHGYINRNGKNITKDAVMQGFQDAFNMVFDATDPGTTSTINLCSALVGYNCTHFDLDMLAQPHTIEHDGSLTRTDKMLQSNHDANNQVYNRSSFVRSMQIYGSATHINLSLANTVRLTRFADMERQDVPGWFVANHGGSSTEHAFILYTMNDHTLGNDTYPQARMDWFKYWMTNQRLPTDLGWQKPTLFPSTGYIPTLAKSVRQASTYTTASPVYTTPPPQTVQYTFVWTRPIKARAAPTAIPSAVAASATAEAKALASARAPPAPTPLNAYETKVSVQGWKDYRSGVAAAQQGFVQEFQAALEEILGEIPL